MFPLKDIKQALNIPIALTPEMQNSISVWHKCYVGRADWCDNDEVYSLGLEKAIVREFSNIVLNEMTTACTNAKLKEIFHHATKRLNKYLQRGFATGALIAKPLGKGNKVQFLAQHEFIPIKFDIEGKPLEVVFPDVRYENKKVYTRLEHHTLTDAGLVIDNKAFVSTSGDALGREVPLSVIDDWKNIAQYIRYPDMKRMAFGYYSNPIDNTVDGSACGVSLFEGAINLIELADKQFGRLEWEFKSGERAIHASEDVVRRNGTMAENKNRLYRSIIGVDEDTPVNNLIQDYSPELRQEDIRAGLEEYKRSIEFKVGLSYGDLSNPAYVEKTATEVEAARTRKYNTVTAIQENLEEFLDDLMYALAFYNSMTLSGYKFSCSFKDSILADEETERKQDIQDISIGVMRKEEYRSKWYGEDAETAKANLPESADILD